MDVQLKGRSYTANHVKLLKHMPKLMKLQDGGIPSPVMLHVSPINACNLTCSFCCFANRSMTERLSLTQMKTAIQSFYELGITGVEFTGGGEPLLHPEINEIVDFCDDLGLKIGICTNGAKLRKLRDWSKITWVRLGLYGFTEGYEYDLDWLRSFDLEISAAYVFDENVISSTNPNITNDFIDPKKKKLASNFQSETDFFEAIEWAEVNRVPTRIAFNAIRPGEYVKADIELIRKRLELFDTKFGERKYAFLSDFNYKADRRNDHCYMHAVKPFLFTDGNIYACPSAELSPENKYDVNKKYKICEWDTIEEAYKNMTSVRGGVLRNFDCQYCKYSAQNELIDDVLMETKHNEFA